MGPDPVGEALRPGGLGIGVAARAEHRDEDRRGAHFAGGRVVDRDRVAGVIDEELLAGAMLVAEHDVLSLEPTAVQAAVAAVAIAVRLPVAVFLPEQLQREVLVGRVAEMTGHKREADEYRKLALEFAKKWV